MKKLNELFMKDWFFVVITTLITAGTLGSTHMFMTYNTGYLNNVLGGSFLKSGDFAGAAGYGGGFLLARILEAPLVGILDIGGSLMHGVPCGIAGLMYEVGLGWIIENFATCILAGALIGAAIGLIIMLVRKLVPSGIQAGGADIMMGVGHQLAEWLAPLFLISAISVSIPIGVCAGIAAAIAYKYNKNMVGAVLIAMFIASFLWPVAAAA